MQRQEEKSVDKNIEKWSTMKDVQDYLGVGRESIMQWINKRNMPAYKVGRLWKFKLSEVDEWIRSGGAAEESGEKNDQSDGPVVIRPVTHVEKESRRR
jgi:excisionase family DNA binding protein